MREPLPPTSDLLWGCVAGVGGGMGLTLLYRALAFGQMGIASPVSALVAAGLPVLVGTFSEGFPGILIWIGFALALVAVWLVSGGVGVKLEVNKLLLPLLSGVGFATFLIFLDRGSGQSILWPLIATRVASISSLLIFSTVTRQSWVPTRDSWVAIVISSVLDSSWECLVCPVRAVGPHGRGGGAGFALSRLDGFAGLVHLEGTHHAIANGWHCDRAGCDCADYLVNKSKVKSR